MTEWGAHLDAPAAATGRFRALFSEMSPAAAIVSVDPDPPAELREISGRARKEATGDLCPKCGGFFVRTGTCMTCQGCGETSGGCS